MDGEPQRPSLRGDRFLAHRGLIALCCGSAMAEAFLLIVVAPGARALAPQVSALPPLAIFHDLRWLYSAQRPWPWFCLLLAGLLLVRAALNTVLIRLAWPAHLTPPPLAALRGGIVVTTLACLLISPLVSLTLGVAILPFSWPFLALLPAMLLIALPLSHAGLADTWWRTLPPVSAAWWLLAEFCVLSTAAAVSTALPPPDAVAVAGLAGLVNARAWYGLTAAIARAAEPAKTAAGQALTGPVQAGPLLGGPVSAALALADPVPPGPVPAGPAPAGAAALTGVGLGPGGHRVPAGPMALAAVIATVIALTRLVFAFGGPAATGRPQATVAWMTGTSTTAPARAAATDAGHHPVLEVAGFGSWCCGQDRDLAKALRGTIVQQFSYRGTNRHGQPLPYGSKASDMPLPELGDRIDAQVWHLHELTGEPVDIVAESEGTLGLDAMLARHPDAPVGSVVLLSPIVAPGQYGYRGGAGSSLVTRDELHAVIWFVGGLSPFGTSGAQTLINSVNSDGARFAAAAARHAPVRLLEVIPLADAVTLPTCPLPGNVVVIPAFHGELLGDPAALSTVRRFLTHRSVAGVPSMRTTAEIMAAAAAAWRMPENATPSPPCGSAPGGPAPGHHRPR